MPQCVGDGDCAVGSYCEPHGCSCVPSSCDALDECDEDADCPVRCDQMTCTCAGEGPAPLSPESLGVLTAGGLTGSCTFTEERDCVVASFEADLSFRVSAGAVEITQLPGSQTSSGGFGDGVTFYTRDAGGSYDEIYLAQFERTPGADPTSPLTPDTVQVRALNASGAEGSLSAIDVARILVALGASAHTGNTPAIDAFLAGTTGICTYNVICVFGSP